MTNELIKIALEEGVPAIDAYNMASFNIAKYYQMDDFLGVRMFNEASRPGPITPRKSSI